MLSLNCDCVSQIKIIFKKRKNSKIIEVVGRQWVVSRSTYRIGRGLSVATADDFCDCPKMAYLGTGWEKKFRMAAAIQNQLLGKRKKSVF